VTHQLAQMAVLTDQPLRRVQQLMKYLQRMRWTMSLAAQALSQTPQTRSRQLTTASSDG